MRDIRGTEEDGNHARANEVGKKRTLVSDRVVGQERCKLQLHLVHLPNTKLVISVLHFYHEPNRSFLLWSKHTYMLSLYG
jgi:hypothetical protein